MNYKIKRTAIQATKIMIGSSCAMLIAMALDLQFATSAAIVALLTIVTTKLETLRLSVYRIISFVIATVLAYIIFSLVSNIWVAYGIYIFLVVFASELAGWKATISVNAVIGTHYLTTHDFSIDFIVNEFLIVLIGISFAIVLNFYSRNNNSEKRLEGTMLYVEAKMQEIIGELAKYLKSEQMERNVWEETRNLEKELEHFIQLSCAYSNNTFKKDGNYFEKYFEMRLMQLSVLHNLHYEMRKIRLMPKESIIVADYILSMKEHVVELNDPTKQMEELEKTLAVMLKKDLPKTVEEFEGRAMLYHVFMDLEEFLMHKKRFFENVKATKRFEHDYHNKKIIKKGE